jgi:hypothetical protein
MDTCSFLRLQNFSDCEFREREREREGGRESGEARKQRVIWAGRSWSLL